MPSLVVDSAPWKAVPRKDARRRSLKDEGRVRLGMEKGEAAAPQRRRAAALAAAIFAVAEQRMAARGELAADLVKASRAQRDAHEGGGRVVEHVGLQHAIVEQGFLDAAAGGCIL